MKISTLSTPVAGRILIPAFMLAVLGAADRAAAQPTEEQVAAIKSACRSDYMSYCWSVPRGGAEALQCLKKNVASLSAPCQQAVKAATATAPVPSSSGTAATAAKPATETKPAAAVESAPSSSPAATEEAAKSAPASSAASGAAATTQSGTANTATSAGQGAAASNAKAARGSSAAAATSQAKAVAKKPSVATSSAAAQGAGSAAAASVPEATSKAKSTAIQATAPVTPPATGAATPPVLGFIPPRKKLMLARVCREDFNAYCPGVDLGGGRAISCLEANKASLTPDCRDQLAKLVP